MWVSVLRQCRAAPGGIRNEAADDAGSGNNGDMALRTCMRVVRWKDKVWSDSKKSKRNSFKHSP